MTEIYNKTLLYGLSGFMSAVKEPKHPVDRSTSAVLNLTGIPEIAAKIYSYNQAIGLTGIHQASRDFLSGFRIGFVTENEPDPESLLGNALLMVSNHDAKLEPVFAASLLPRNDLVFLGGTETERLGDNIASHVLPVKPRRYASTKDSVRYGKAMSEEEILQMNEKSLTEASDRLVGGGAIGMFPTGGRNKIDGRWYGGLGKLVARIGYGERTKINFLPIMFTGFRDIDFKKMLLSMTLNSYPSKQKDIKAQFGNISKLSDIVGRSDDPNAITTLLRHYYLWSLGIK